MAQHAYDLDRRAGIRRRCESIIDKLLHGGNGAVTTEDYRGLATDALWLLGEVDDAEGLICAYGSGHATAGAAARCSASTQDQHLGKQE